MSGPPFDICISVLSHQSHQNGFVEMEIVDKRNVLCKQSSLGPPLFKETKQKGFGQTVIFKILLSDHRIYEIIFVS